MAIDHYVRHLGSEGGSALDATCKSEFKGRPSHALEAHTQFDQCSEPRCGMPLDDGALDHNFDAERFQPVGKACAKPRLESVVAIGQIVRVEDDSLAVYFAIPDLDVVDVKHAHTRSVCALLQDGMSVQSDWYTVKGPF